MIVRARHRRLLRLASPLAPVVLLLAILLPTLAGGSLWLDEIRSLELTRDLGTVFTALRDEEANMGLYYLLLRAWRLLGDSDAHVRALSLLAAAAALPFVHRVGGRSAAFLLVLHGTFLGFAREVRGYAWMLALMLAATALLARAVQRGQRRDAIAWAICAALAFHAHALATALVVAHVLAVVLARRHVVPAARRQVAAAFALWLVLTIPLVFLQARAPLDWIPVRSLDRALRDLAVSAGGGHALTAWLWLVAPLAATVVVVRAPPSFARALALAMAWVPPLLLLAIDRAVQPLYLERYGVVVVPGLVLVTAAALRRATRLRLLRAALVLLIGAAAVVGLDLRPKEDWRGAAEHLRAHARPGDVVVVFAYFCRPALERYLGGVPVEVVELASGPYSGAGGQRLPDPDLGRLEALAVERRRVWLVSSHERFPRLGRDAQHAAIDERLQRTLGPGVTRRFRGVRAGLYVKRSSRL